MSSHAQKALSKSEFHDPGSQRPNWRKQSQLFLYPADGSERCRCLHVLAARSPHASGSPRIRSAADHSDYAPLDWNYTNRRAFISHLSRTNI